MPIVDPPRSTADRVRDVVARLTVVLIDGDVAFVAADDIGPAVADAYAAHASWDPRPNAATTWLVVTPTRIRAWREENELAGREVMRDGSWLA